MTKSKHKKKKKRSLWGVFFRPIKIILSLFLVFVLLGCVAAGVGVYIFRDEIIACKEKADSIMANSSREDFSHPTDTRIFDADGNVIGVINLGHYEYVTIDQIGENLQEAYIAQEDRRFYEHNGIDYISLVRAGLALIKNKGEITQGGSTITQQVIKNTYLTQERTFERKIIEFFAAPQMEARYSKGEILEFYCNTNFYANRCYGVAAASRYYFDKTPLELEIWEAATLAGISNNPSRFDPVRNLENCVEKRNRVIDNMAKCGYITEEERDYAKAQPLEVKQVYVPGTTENYQTSYAIHCATIELMKNDGFTFQYVFDNKEEYDTYNELYQEAYQNKSDLIRSGGFEIYTSLDMEIQEKLQDAIDTHLAEFTELQENGKYALQGAAVCVDNKTGYVVAISGGRGTDDEYNRGFLSRRQPGSTIKPLIDYAPAFETGFYYPSRLVNDHQFENGPKNSGGRYYGEVSVREALNRSLNTVAWQVLQDIGVETGMDYLAKMHFMGMSYLDNGNASMSIGGFTEGARVVDMAKGYSVLANGGMYSNNTCIRGIVSQYDGELYNANQPDERVFTEDTAYMITDILKGTMDQNYGTGYGLDLAGMEAAGKTGTTNDNKDAWFCGYTKYYTTAVWMGYDTPKAMPGVYGRTYAGQIWHDFMEEIHEGLPNEDWKMPSTVSYSYVDSRGEKTSTNTGRQDLFSSVAEAAARADQDRWEEVQEQKEEEARQEQERQSAEAASQEAVNQALTRIQEIVSELNGMEYHNSSTDAQIAEARTLLEQIAATDQYESLKQQVDEAASRLAGLPSQGDWELAHPQEIGPGVGLTGPGETTTQAPPGSEAVQGVKPGSDSENQVQQIGPGM